MKEIFTCKNIFVQSFVCAAAAWWCERRLAGSRHRGESEAAGQPASLASTGGHRAHLPRLPRPAGPVQPPQFSILEGQCQSGAGRPTATRQPGLIWPGIYLREQLTQLEARGGRKEVSFLINPYWEPHYPHCLLSGQTTHSPCLTRAWLVVGVVRQQGVALRQRWVTQRSSCYPTTSFHSSHSLHFSLCHSL